MQYLALAVALGRVKLAVHLHHGGSSNARQGLRSPVPLFPDDEWRVEAPGPAYPAELLQDLVSLVPVLEGAAFDRLAEELLGQREERRDEEKEGGEPESND